MISAVTIEDFVGFWKISANSYQKTYLQDYIDQFQDLRIRQIISADAWVEIDAAGIASKPKWENLFNGVEVYDNVACNERISMCGITETLKGLLYFQFVRDTMSYPTESGNVESLNEVSKRTNNVHNGMISAIRWNQAIKKLKEQVLPFIENYEQVKESITSSIDNGGGSYTINLNSTFYLSDSETVTIDGVEYTTSNLVENISFDISGAVIGLDFTDELAVWEPYKDFPLCHSLCKELRPVSI